MGRITQTVFFLICAICAICGFAGLRRGQRFCIFIIHLLKSTPGRVKDAGETPAIPGRRAVAQAMPGSDNAAADGRRATARPCFTFD